MAGSTAINILGSVVDSGNVATDKKMGFRMAQRHPTDVLVAITVFALSAFVIAVAISILVSQPIFFVGFGCGYLICKYKDRISVYFYDE